MQYPNAIHQDYSIDPNFVSHFQLFVIIIILLCFHALFYALLLNHTVIA